MENENENHTNYCRGAQYDLKWYTEHVNKIPENLSLADIQKRVLNKTAHIVRRTLSL